MNKQNFFAKVSSKNQKRVLLFSGILSLVLVVVLSVVDKPLKTTSAPNGIVSFELAGSFERAAAILNSWDAEAEKYAAFSLGLDFLFLFAYSIFFALVILKLSEAHGTKTNPFSRTGVPIAYLQFAAAFFDAAENVCLISLLFGSQNLSLAVFAFYFSSVKFGFIALGVLFIVSASVALIAKKTKTR